MRVILFQQIELQGKSSVISNIIYNAACIRMQAQGGRETKRRKLNLGWVIAYRL